MTYSVTRVALSMRLAAASFASGVAIFFIASGFHPSDAPAHVSHLAFAEYAESAAWVDAHVGQFVGALLLFLGFVGLRERLRNDGSFAAALSAPAAVCTTVTLAVIAVLQAVDGPALKHAVVAWHSAPAGAEDAALRVAEAVRWIEIGLNSYFRIMLGLTLVLFGVALSASHLFPRWLGWAGIFAGIGSVLQGLYVGHHGFDVTVFPPIAFPTLAYFGWFVVAAFILWRYATRLMGGHSGQQELPAGLEATGG